MTWPLRPDSPIYVPPTPTERDYAPTSPAFPGDQSPSWAATPWPEPLWSSPAHNSDSGSGPKSSQCQATDESQSQQNLLGNRDAITAPLPATASPGRWYPTSPPFPPVATSPEPHYCAETHRQPKFGDKDVAGLVDLQGAEKRACEEEEEEDEENLPDIEEVRAAIRAEEKKISDAMGRIRKWRKLMRDLPESPETQIACLFQYF